MKRIVMTGALGNTGLHVLKQIRLLRPDLPILALIRQHSDTTLLKELKTDWLECDLDVASSYEKAIGKDDVLLEIANLRYARKLLPVFYAAGVERAFCVTTTGVFSVHHSYSALYKQIEDEMRKSSMNITILRPSMIYGNERDKNMHKLLKLIAKYSIYPVFGTGESLMQPVHVEDLSQAIAQAITHDVAGEFNLAGPVALPYRRIVDEAFAALGKRSLTVLLPVKPVAVAAGLLQRIPRFPVKQEQVIRLQEDKAFDISAAREKLNYRPRAFAEGIRQEVNRLRQLGILRA